MRKMSKTAKAEAYDAIVKERSLYEHMTHLLVNKETPDVTAVVFIGDDSEKVEYRLYGVERAHGGVVLIIHHENIETPATPASVDVQYFEDWLHHVRSNAAHGTGIDWKIRDAAENLETKRRKLYQQKEGKHV